MKSAELIAVFAENKIGQMEQITRVLADEQINIRLVTVATSEKFGVVKILVDQTEQGFRALKKCGWTVSLVPVLAIEVKDKPGGLHAVADCLVKSGVNIENSSGFVANSRAVLLIETHDIDAARKALAKGGMPVLSRDDLLAL